MRRHDAGPPSPLRAGLPPGYRSPASGAVRLALGRRPAAAAGLLDLRPAARSSAARSCSTPPRRASATLPAPFDPQRLEADPVDELVRAYFDTIPDAFRRPDTHLYDYLRRQIADRRVQGMVLVRPLWCDHWHAQRERLKQCTGLPLVQIDLGDQDHELQRTPDPPGNPREHPAMNQPPARISLDQWDQRYEQLLRPGPGAACLRRPAAPPRGRRRLQAAETAFRQLAGRAAPVELPADRGEPPASPPATPAGRSSAR